MRDIHSTIAVDPGTWWAYWWYRRRKSRRSSRSKRSRSLGATCSRLQHLSSDVLSDQSAERCPRYIQAGSAYELMSVHDEKVCDAIMSATAMTRFLAWPLCAAARPPFNTRRHGSSAAGSATSRRDASV